MATYELEFGVWDPSNPHTARRPPKNTEQILDDGSYIHDHSSVTNATTTNPGEIASSTYLLRLRPTHKERLELEAAKRGMTLATLFRLGAERLLSDDDEEGNDSV